MGSDQLASNIDLENATNRKLICETHGIFMDTQPSEDDTEPASLTQISYHYRSVLHSCINELRNSVTDNRFPIGQNELMEAQLDLLTITEMIWHLAEIIFIDTLPGGYCLPKLTEWIRSHFTETDRLAQQVMSVDDPYNHDEYWNTIYGLVMQGRLPEVADLLKHHPERDEGRFDSFASLEELLLKMPMYEMSAPGNEFISAWKNWHEECLIRIRDGDFSKQSNLLTVAQMLAGEEAVLEQHKDILQSWYQLTLVKLLYTDPTVTTSNLKGYTISCIELFDGICNLTPLDEIIVSCFANDVHKVIDKCSECLPSWWLSAHLSDLLYHAGKLKNDQFGANLRDHLIIEYSKSLLANQSLTTIAADYLMACPEQGRDILGSHIDQMTITTEKEALKAIRMCEKFGFGSIAHAICKRMGMKALSRKRLGVSLSWCLRSKDEEFASFLTEQFLNHYAENGGFVQQDLIENLGSGMLLNNKLTFLAKYHEFHKLYGNSDFKQAGLLLTSLLTSNLAPKRFWLILLLDALPLLEHDEIIFSSEQTFELMHSLKELQLIQDATDTIANWRKLNPAVDDEEEKDKIDLLQLGLSRNLSRALLVEAGDDALR